MRPCAAAALIALGGVAQGSLPPRELPASATTSLARSLAASKAHRRHVWRDTAPFNADGTLNGYVEIARGDRRKWEYDMASNARAIDRVMPDDPGGYPVNYGFVPQTVSYDGDPFDVLVLGPPIAGGRLVRGFIVGLMQMEDEKGLDSKVVMSLVDRNGRATHGLTAEEEHRIGDYFRRYKLHETGKFSKVPGWAGPEEGLAFVKMTHAFFRECRNADGRRCQVPGPVRQGYAYVRTEPGLKRVVSRNLERERWRPLYEVCLTSREGVG